MKIFTKKKFVGKNFRKKIFSEKILKIILAVFFIFEKNSVESRLIFEKKNRKKFVK